MKSNRFVSAEEKSGSVKLRHSNPQVAHYFDRVASAQKIAINSSVGCGRRWLWLLFAMALLVLPLTTLAQSGDTAPVVLTDQQDKYPLGLYLELLADPTGQLTIDDVSSPAYDDQYIPSQAEIPNFGFTSDAIWARFEVRNETSNATTWRLALADARPKYVDLYLPAEDGNGWEHHQAGRSRPFTVREVAYRYGVFKLPLTPGQTQVVYLRFQSGTPFLLPLTVWSLEAFSHHAQTELLRFGLFYGVMLVMLGYNLFLFASLRDRSYLYLVLFIACLGLSDAFREGLAQQYLWPAWRNLYGIEITATLIYIIAILFGASFLQTKIHTPRLHNIMMATIPGFLLAFFNLLLGGSVAFHLALGLLTMTLLVVAGYMTWRQGYRPGRYYLLAWLIFLGAAFFHNLANTGLLPGTPFGQGSVQIGGALMALLLSLALADRINLLQAETDRSNRALRNSDHRLRQFLEAMPVGVAVVDVAARLSFINQKALALFNLPADVPPDEPLDLAREINARRPLFVAGTRQPYPLEELPLNRVLQQGQSSSVDDIEVHGLAQPIQLETWASPIFDEQGQLQYAVNAFQDITDRKKLELELRRHRDHLEESLAERTGQLSTFFDMTMLVSEARTLPQVVDVAVNRIMEFCQCQALVLHLMDDDHTTLNLLTQRGLTLAQQEQFQTIPLEMPLSDWLLQRQEPLLALEPDKVAFLPMFLRLDGCQAYIGVQLRAAERILGMLTYYRFTKETFSVDEVSLLVALAEQLGVIIENHRLRGHIEEIAVVAERQRLARDLHDSINQSLYSINLFTHAAREASEDDDPTQLADRLTRIETIALDALKEMRLLLYQMQPDVLAEQGLAEALQLRLDTVERRLGIDVDYQVVGEVDDLPPNIAEALYRAAMEALNNSLKHSEASQLKIRLTMNEPVIELEITDNGRGFEPEQVNRGMGLENIRQRLEQLNGCLSVSSAVGTGTSVEFAVSLDGEPVKQGGCIEARR
jgi:signal transduction histidine kinase